MPGSDSAGSLWALSVLRLIFPRPNGNREVDGGKKQCNVGAVPSSRLTDFFPNSPATQGPSIIRGFLLVKYRFGISARRAQERQRLAPNGN
jgi:hypothetical protein